MRLAVLQLLVSIPIVFLSFSVSYEIDMNKLMTEEVYVQDHDALELSRQQVYGSLVDEYVLYRDNLDVMIKDQKINESAIDLDSMLQIEEEISRYENQ